MTRSHPRKKFYLVAGEPSGDTLGALLIEALRRQEPEAVFRGAGGPKMAAAGQRQTVDLTKHAVVGLVEVLRHYPELRKLFHRLVREVEAARPDAVVLIDYPGFNLRLARVLRRRLPWIRIVFYVSPQVWAWKSGRAELLSESVDELLVLFPFEKEWYAQRGSSLSVSWVGHPLWDRLLSNEMPTLPPDRQTIALLPGSRESEIQRHLPLLLGAAAQMQKQREDLDFLWIVPDLRREAFARAQLALYGLECSLRLRVGYPLSHLSRCRLALLCSGSASLECAAVGTPQILVYKANPITYTVAKRVVRVRFLSMVNLLADSEIIPELVQERLSPDEIAHAALRLLANSVERARMVEAMGAALRPIAEPGASARAASRILALAARPRKTEETGETKKSTVDGRVRQGAREVGEESTAGSFASDAAAGP
ncbi:lipid-A-disaccharide synthase [Methylacidimicrobium cyclopophantes]|uniref:Lipid-A-disaccharide synthase n=1 Tax=Methylacidimicrobium cyclopophantes TaxID=1041766 RepID=A0A5E6MMV2_9BACT|nr:lipid-A-disaccharide synthase [Methylacidimicrobium cyclopophantes]VVM07371.1 lipid-A-disaccharide synthase [Methylacidimicrobium cyclopophantes]